MTRTGLLAAACMTAGILGGCAQPIGRARPLGEVSYEAAFATAREVMAQYFARADRLLGGSPARQVATMRLRRDGRQVVAHLAVAVQRPGSAAHRQMRMNVDNYSSVPNQTPAQVEAATTPGQNESWRTDRYDRVMEQKILTQLHRSLHPQPKR